MRVLSFFALFLPFVAAASNHKLETRALLPSVDVCANINLNIHAALGLPDIFNNGRLGTCLCVSTLRPYVQANVLLRNVAKIVGETAVLNLLMNVITGQGSNCMYPAHALPVCRTGAPCDFGCTDGYQRAGGNCVCISPKIECNGMCQTQACSSAVPQNPNKRSVDQPAARSRMRILTDERCRSGQRLCGAGGSRRRGADNWECIDTRSTLDSCGGCMYHHSLDDRPVEGIDCSAIPGVSGVECRAGRCHVHRCKRGWSVGSNSSECVPQQAHLS